jgi:hypothetical protein
MNLRPSNDNSSMSGTAEHPPSWKQYISKQHPIISTTSKQYTLRDEREYEVVKA